MFVFGLTALLLQRLLQVKLCSPISVSIAVVSALLIVKRQKDKNDWVKIVQVLRLIVAADQRESWRKYEGDLTN